MITISKYQREQFLANAGAAVPQYVFVRGKQVEVPAYVHEAVVKVFYHNWIYGGVEPTFQQGSQMAVQLLS